jgi:hypothetical protein
MSCVTVLRLLMWIMEEPFSVSAYIFVVLALYLLPIRGSSDMYGSVGLFAIHFNNYK